MDEKLPTDTERREVARRLRKAIGLTEFAEALGFNWTDDSDWGWKDVSNLVADLIEPAQDHFADSDKMVDRDALLALAGELSGDTLVVPAVYGTYAGGYVAACQDVARRIREALGVSDG